MPYRIKRQGENAVVVKKDTGEVVAVHKPPNAEEKAVAQVRLLYAKMNDEKPT